MDYKEFSASIKAKYPQYADLDDLDLAKRMVTKYPQYSDVTFEPTKEEKFKQMVEEDKPLQSLPLGFVAKDQPFETTGEIVTEKLGEKGFPAQISAGIGTAIAKAPDIAAAYTGVKAAPTIAKGLGSLKQAIFKPKQSVQTLRNLRENLRNVPIKKATEAEKLESLRQSYGSNIGKAREAAQIPQGPLGELYTPKNISKFTDEMQVVASKTPENLLEAYGKEGLARLKDSVQALRETGKIESGTRVSAEVNKAVTQIDAALAKVSPELEESLGGYRLVKEQIEGLPQHYKELAIGYRNQIAKELAKKKGGATREIVKKALKAGLPWVGGSLLGKFL